MPVRSDTQDEMSRGALSDLDVRKRQLQSRIDEKRRAISDRLEGWRTTASAASTAATAVVTGAVLLIGAVIAVRAFRSFPRGRLVRAS